MKRWLFEFDTGNRFGPCSDESWERFQKALEQGRPFFLYPFFGYHLRMRAEEVPDALLDAVHVRDMQREKAPG